MLFNIRVSLANSQGMHRFELHLAYSCMIHLIGTNLKSFLLQKWIRMQGSQGMKRQGGQSGNIGKLPNEGGMIIMGLAAAFTSRAGVLLHCQLLEDIQG